MERAMTLIHPNISSSSVLLKCTIHVEAENYQRTDEDISSNGHLNKIMDTRRRKVASEFLLRLKYEKRKKGWTTK